MYASMPVRGRIILIIAAAACVYVVGNGRIALWDRDEPRYALASQWMARSGDWVVPRIGWGAQPTQWRTAKPILTYWCQATAMKCLGVSAFAARLPSSVAVTLTLIVMALAVWRRLGPEQAMWTVLILASSALVIAAAKMCITDALLLLWITIAQLALLSIYHRAQCGDGPGWGVPIVMWIAAGLAGLTKGPVVLGVMCATLMVLAVLDVGANVGRWRSWGAAIAWWRRLRPIVGLVVLGAVTGPWLYLIHQRAPGFLHDAIWHDVIGRAGAPLEGHKGPPGFYLASIWGTYLPWSLLLPLAMVLGYRHRKQPVIRFALAGVIGPWLMM
jgi:4-amino-4-deoxy-L-arabinose transferase-like glycosyltransferase